MLQQVEERTEKRKRHRSERWTQDICIEIKFTQRKTFAEVAKAVGVSASQLTQCIKRGIFPGTIERLESHLGFKAKPRHKVK